MEHTLTDPQPSRVVFQVDNWRFLFCWQRSLGVMCMGEQLKSDSLPLLLSLSRRVVIELPAGVRPTGGVGVTFTTVRLRICTALRQEGHPVPIKTRQVQSFRCNIFTNPTLHHFSLRCQRRQKLMYYKRVLGGGLRWERRARPPFHSFRWESASHRFRQDGWITRCQ